MMRPFFASWQRFWFREVPPHSMALLRIAFGLFLSAYWLVYLPRAGMLFSESGLLQPLLAAPENHLLALFVVPLSPAATYVIYALALLSIVLFTLGWDMRMNAFSIALYMLYYYQLSFHNFPSSYNRILLFVTLVFALSGADRAYSLRMRHEKGSFTAWEPVPAWPQMLIALQLTATYVGVSLQKLMIAGWYGGEVLSYSFIGRWATPLGFSLVRLNVPIAFYDWLTNAVELGQILLPFGLWMRKFQWWAFAFGAVFHGLVTVFLGMWWFLVLIPCYIVFLDPDSVRRWACRRLERKPE